MPPDRSPSLYGFAMPLISAGDYLWILPRIYARFCSGNITVLFGTVAKNRICLFRTSVPKLTVIVRKGYGGAYIVMGSKHVRADFVFVWPTAEVAVMGAEGAVNILHGRDLKAMEDKEAAAQKRKELAEEYRDKFSSPYTSAGQGHVDDVIIPSENRQP